MTTPSLDQSVCRVAAEYLEMPGLRLTLAQAARLSGLEAAECEMAVRALVGSGFLVRTERGFYVRPDVRTRE